MNTIKLNGVTVDVEEARKAVAEFDAQKDKLIGGLTIEQWQRVIDSKFYCEFGNNGEWRNWIDLLDDVNVTGGLPFRTPYMFGYDMCRPAQRYGIRVPVFGKRPEWLKDDDTIIYRKYNKGSAHPSGEKVGPASICDVLWYEVLEIIAMPVGGKVE